MFSAWIRRRCRLSPSLLLGSASRVLCSAHLIFFITGHSPKLITDRDLSTSSSRFRGLHSARMRRGLTRGIASIIQQRRHLRVTSEGVDLTPKLLSHNLYPAIDEKQITAFDAIGMNRSDSIGQLGQISSSSHGAHRGSSLSLIKSSSVHTNVLPSEEMMESLFLQSGIGSEHGVEVDRAPSQFCLPRYDSSIFHVKPEKVTIIIKETETFFLFEMPQLTEDLDTPDGVTIKEANERYEYITVGAGSNRKLVNAETQTPRVHTKSRSTHADRHKRQNCGTFVNNWVMYDTYNAPQLKAIEDVEHVVSNVTTETGTLENKEPRQKFSRTKSHQGTLSLEDQLTYIHEKTGFREAVRVMERIIASNLYIVPQKRFKNLIRQDPYSLDFEFTYSLDLLWTHSCSLTENRPVTCFKWNPVNGNLLVAGYGASPFHNDGVLLVWCAKNPSQPDRIYKFECPISDADWSKNKPNQLAVGFYDGTITVIDVSKKDLVVMRKSSRQTSPSYSPHWQVQWWSEDEQFDFQEQIYTANEDGRILCYRTGQDFTSTEMMRIPRFEGKIGGVKKTNNCSIYDIPMSRNPGALLLRQHPNLNDIYLVGTDEGCLHRCSTNYLHQHIESFLVHDGPVYSLEFSPFCWKIFLTCGADWCTRIWADGIDEPLITLSTDMSCVRGATWCPTNSTVIASIVHNEICIWDIKRKTYRPTSITVSQNSHRFVALEFTKNGNQLVVADVEGNIYIYSLEGMPFPPFDQTSLLVKSIEKALVTKPKLLRKLKKIGTPF